jgi:hypothetical protein
VSYFLASGFGYRVDWALVDERATEVQEREGIKWMVYREEHSEVEGTGGRVTPVWEVFGSKMNVEGDVEK